MSNVLSIGIGGAPNDNTGDPLRTSMTEIMTAVNGLAGNFNGPSAPSSLIPFQSWFDTSTTPPTLRYYDGAQWVAAATLNQSTHTWASLGPISGSVGGDLTGTLPNPTIAKIQGIGVAGTSGTGNVIFSTSPTLTGTFSAASGTLSGTLGVTGLATLGAEVITAAPSLTVAPTGNPVTTLTSHNIQGSSSSSTTVEFLSNIGFAMNTGSSGAFVNSDAKVAQYVGGTCSSGCKSAWAVNHLMQLNTPLNAHFFAALTEESDFNNSSGNNFHNSYGAIGAITQYVGNLLITGLGTSQADFAICFGGLNVTTGLGMYNRGILFPSGLGAIQADIQTESSAAAGWADFGTHSFGIDLKGTAYSQTAVWIHPVGSSGAGITSLGTYTVASYTDGSTAPYGMFLGGTYATAALFAGGLVQLTASTISKATLNLPQGATPTTPNNGDIWMTSLGLFYRFNGTTHGPL